MGADAGFTEGGDGGAGTRATVELRRVTVGLRSRLMLWLMRLVIKPFLARMLRKGPAAIVRAQLLTAGLRCPDTAGLSLDYRIVGGRVPGHVLGALQASRRVVLWLHGGAFVLPAAPNMHLVLVARLCRDLDADGFVPDYRLGPFNRFPAALDDCERAYRALLDAGHAPAQIVLGGDSAGGNLALGLLQRIRAAGLPMPACAVALSPATELGRIHAPASRHANRRRDPLLPVAALHRLDELYAGNWDASDPQLSPLYMDCHGLPPLFFQASADEILRDDTVLLARRARAAGADVTCHVWSDFPHAVALFEPYCPELKEARMDIAAFARRHLAERHS